MYMLYVLLFSYKSKEEMRNKTTCTQHVHSEQKSDM